MPARLPCSLATLGASFIGAVVLIEGCGSSATAPPAVNDASTIEGGGEVPDSATNDDGGPTSDAADASDSAEASMTGTGETCIGFAKKAPCGENGQPDYGYLCVNGSPPGIAGCKLATSGGSFGDTYCCTENKCVAEPDQDKKCASAATPHRYQCPPEGAGTVTPPTGCVSAGPGGPLEEFYCCP